MKIALVYYSFSGKTQRAAEHLRQELVSRNQEAVVIEIKPQVEERNFFRQCLAACFKKKTELKSSLNYELSEFDYVIFASAVWAFTITPALRSYLEKAEGLQNKKAGCFLTYGSGTGARKALKELEGILLGKGTNLVYSECLQGLKTKNKNYLEGKFSSLLNCLSL